MEQIVTIIALIVSIILHEMAHGYAANALGDPTARLQGRLSPNPLVHIDLLGSIIIPGILLFTQSSMLFGWAKPVPYNPYNFSNQKWGEALVAIAGPATNLLLALIFGLIIRVSDVLSLSQSFIEISIYIVYINVLLAIFNMIPVPPLDGSKILAAFLPPALAFQYRKFTSWVERHALFVMFAFIFIFINFLSAPFSYLVSTIVELIAGVRIG